MARKFYRLGAPCPACEDHHVLTPETTYDYGSIQCRRVQIARSRAYHQRVAAGLPPKVRPPRKPRPAEARRAPGPLPPCALSAFRAGAWRAIVVDGGRELVKQTAFRTSRSAFMVAQDWRAQLAEA